MKTTIVIATYPGDKHDPIIFEHLHSLKNRYPILIGDREIKKTFAKNNNDMAKKATTPYVLFLNSDTVPHEGFVEEMEKILDLHKQIGVVGCKLVYVQDVCKSVVFEKQKFTRNGKAGKVQHAGIMFTKGMPLPYEYGDGLDVDDPTVNVGRPVGAVTGACMMVRQSEFLELGGFDENFVNGWEDTDLCLRYVEKGYLSYYQPKALVEHYYSSSEDRHKKEDDNVAYWKEKWIQSGKIFKIFFNIPIGTDKLDIGCGGKKKDGYFGIDKHFVTNNTDLLYNLEEISPKMQLPFATNSIKNIYCSHVLEHLSNTIEIINEMHRLLSPDGWLHLVVPHAVSWSGIASPFHKKYFVPETFRFYFASDMREELIKDDPEMGVILPWHIESIEETPIPLGMDPYKIGREIVVKMRPLKEVKNHEVKI